MTVTIKDLISSAADKDPSEFESKFSAIMSDKLNDALEAKYDDMFGVSREANETSDVDLEQEIENEDA